MKRKLSMQSVRSLCCDTLLDGVAPNGKHDRGSRKKGQIKTDGKTLLLCRIGTGTGKQSADIFTSILLRCALHFSCPAAPMRRRRRLLRVSSMHVTLWL